MTPQHDKPKRWQISLWTLLTLVTLTAIFLATCRLEQMASVWTIVLLVGFAFRATWERRRNLFVITLAFYLPYVWLLSLNFTNDYHLHWIKMWPILPGLVLAHLGLHQQPDWISQTASAAISLFLIGIAVLLGRRGTWWLVGVATITLLASIFNSVVCYALFRA
ncbi:MAG: hypothetical protein H6822_19660 [Planctomycetaceae bacterium]|nr:hypothetical protein [Planctomycetaceae bacterium]